MPENPFSTTLLWILQLRSSNKLQKVWIFLRKVRCSMMSLYYKIRRTYFLYFMFTCLEIFLEIIINFQIVYRTSPSTRKKTLRIGILDVFVCTYYFPTSSCTVFFLNHALLAVTQFQIRLKNSYFASTFNNIRNSKFYKNWCSITAMSWYFEQNTCNVKNKCFWLYTSQFCAVQASLMWLCPRTKVQAISECSLARNCLAKNCLSYF